ncbi:MAG TPA: hypothetical protein PK926_08940 [Spirochaetota bacterium]|nr:hypothetical protein [Spirochaetota bacterium]HPI88584.1 hypothetical protein [Spirochaetota bacterium]HPR48225.1 hypothetical protein [Spirochaetota bacterium]
MPALKNISIEYKATAFFGMCALVLSFLIGIIAGVSGAVVAVRSIVLTVVFSVLGFAVVAIIKKFVPEVYELISKGPGTSSIDVNIDDNAEGETAAPGPELNQGITEEEPAGEPEIERQPVEAEASSGTAAKSEFSEFKDDDFPKMHSTGSSSDSGLNVALNSSESRQFGKHIMVQDEFFQYEPKVMAEAVRTMMKKDED